VYPRTVCRNCGIMTRLLKIATPTKNIITLAPKE
jgi:hypothetical protein